MLKDKLLLRNLWEVLNYYMNFSNSNALLLFMFLQIEVITLLDSNL